MGSFKHVCKWSATKFVYSLAQEQVEVGLGYFFPQYINMWIGAKYLNTIQYALLK